MIVSFPDLCPLLTLPTRDQYEPINEIEVLITYALSPFERLITSSAARGLRFGLCPPLLPYFVYVRGEGSGETGHMY